MESDRESGFKACGRMTCRSDRAHTAHVHQRVTEGVSDVWVTRSDWRTDPSLSEKEISQLFDAGATETD